MWPSRCSDHNDERKEPRPGTTVGFVSVEESPIAEAPQVLVGLVSDGRAARKQGSARARALIADRGPDGFPDDICLGNASPLRGALDRLFQFRWEVDRRLVHGRMVPPLRWHDRVSSTDDSGIVTMGPDTRPQPRTWRPTPVPPRRRPTSRRGAPRGRPAGDREPSLAPAFNSLLRDARGLHADPDPLQAEAFASSVISVMPRALIDVDDPEAFFGRRLVDHLQAKRTDDALALLLGVAAITTSQTLARLARAGALRLRVAGRKEPSWAGTVGRSRFVEAFAPVDPYQEQDLVVSTFEYPDGSRHALVYLADQNFDGLVRQAHVAADADEVRRAFLESSDLGLRPVDAQEVADRLEQGLRIFDMSIDPPCDEDTLPLIPLLRARQRALPPPIEMVQRRFSDAERHTILDEFARSKEAGRSRAAVELADFFVSCRLERLDADPLRWSPIAVEMCLLDWLPRKATLDAASISAVPDALRRWVRFAGRKKGLAADAMGETLAAIDQFGAEFQRAMRNPARFGPAKALVDAMRAEGVDPTDPGALGAWIEGFNERPLGERDAILGAAGGRGRSGREGSDDVAARRSWAVSPARGMLNAIDLSALDPADPEDREILIEAEHPQFARALRRNDHVVVNGERVNPSLHLALHAIVANQLWDGVPPETWAAARRLIAQGIDRHDVLHMLMGAVSDIVFAALNDPLADRNDELRAALDALGRDSPRAPRRTPT